MPQIAKNDPKFYVKIFALSLKFVVTEKVFFLLLECMHHACWDGCEDACAYVHGTAAYPGLVAVIKLGEDLAVGDGARVGPAEPVGAHQLPLHVPRSGP